MEHEVYRYHHMQEKGRANPLETAASQDQQADEGQDTQKQGDHRDGIGTQIEIPQVDPGNTHGSDDTTDSRKLGAGKKLVITANGMQWADTEKQHHQDHSGQNEGKRICRVGGYQQTLFIGSPKEQPGPQRKTQNAGRQGEDRQVCRFYQFFHNWSPRLKHQPKADDTGQYRLVQQIKDQGISADKAEGTDQKMIGEAVLMGMMYFCSESLREELKVILNKLKEINNVDYQNINFDTDKAFMLLKNDKKCKDNFVDVIYVENPGEAEIRKTSLDELKIILEG